MAGGLLQDAVVERVTIVLEFIGILALIYLAVKFLPDFIMFVVKFFAVLVILGLLLFLFSESIFLHIHTIGGM